MASAQAGYGGTLGGRFRLVLNVNEIQVDAANNRSLIRVQVYMTCVQAAGRTFNLDPTPGNINVDGQVLGKQINGYDFNPGVGANFFMVNTQDFWIGHNADGSRNVGVSAYHNASISPFVTAASVGLNLQLTYIPRYANIVAFDLSQLNDIGFALYVRADAHCNAMEVSIDNGASWLNLGDGSERAITFRNLPSDTLFNVRTRITRADSGFQTVSGTQQIRTLAQNNFIALL